MAERPGAGAALQAPRSLHASGPEEEPQSCCKHELGKNVREGRAEGPPSPYTSVPPWLLFLHLHSSLARPLGSAVLGPGAEVPLTSPWQLHSWLECPHGVALASPRASSKR